MTKDKKEGRISRTIAVPESLYRAIEDMAHDNRISVNEQIVRSLAQTTGGPSHAPRSNGRGNDQTPRAGGGLSRSA